MLRAMRHREETSWNLRIEASAEFDPDYDGELDGYVWREELFREVQRRAAAALLRELAAIPGWRVRTGNRGLPATDEILIHLELDADRAEAARRRS
jgi:hypothetical protein